MNTGKLVFSQVIDHLPLYTFQRCVKRYQGNYKIKTFTCMDQYLCMAFAQITFRESLRDIEVCLRAQKKKLYHMGIRFGRIHQRFVFERIPMGSIPQNQSCNQTAYPFRPSWKYSNFYSYTAGPVAHTLPSARPKKPTAVLLFMPLFHLFINSLLFLLSVNFIFFL